jgi:glycerol kinase
VRYLLEGTVNAAGSAVEWAERIMGPASRRSPSSGGLDHLPIVVPALAGLGAPHWRSDLGAAIFDVHPGVGAGDLRAATLAGVACRLREIVECIEAGGRPIARIVVAGGLSSRQDFLEILAALLDRPLFHSGAPDATARGAALLAGHAMGEWDLEGRRGPPTPVRRLSRPPRSRGAQAYYRRFLERLEQLLASPAAAKLALSWRPGQAHGSERRSR